MSASDDEGASAVGLAEALGHWTTAAATDALLRIGSGHWMTGISPIAGGAVAGRARTVVYGPIGSAGGEAMSVLAEICPMLNPGDVVVVAAGGTPAWVTGGATARVLQTHGAVGLITDGAVRDISEMQRLAFPVFARGASALPYRLDQEIVAIDVPVECGGALIHPGDLVLADAEGIVSVRPDNQAEFFRELRDVINIERDEQEALERDPSYATLLEIVARKRQRLGGVEGLTPQVTSAQPATGSKI